MTLLGELVSALSLLVALVRAGVPRVPFVVTLTERGFELLSVLGQTVVHGERLALTIALSGDLRLQRAAAVAQAREAAQRRELVGELLCAALSCPGIIATALGAFARVLCLLVARLTGEDRGGLGAGLAGLLEQRARLVALRAGLVELLAGELLVARRVVDGRRVVGAWLPWFWWGSGGDDAGLSSLAGVLGLGVLLVRQRDRDRRDLKLGTSELLDEPGHLPGRRAGSGASRARPARSRSAAQTAPAPAP